MGWPNDDVWWQGGWGWLNGDVIRHNAHHHYQNLLEIYLSFRGYTRVQNVCPGWKTDGNQGNHQNFDPTLQTKKLWSFNMRMKQKKYFFWNIFFQNGRQKKAYFSRTACIISISSYVTFLAFYIFIAPVCPHDLWSSICLLEFVLFSFKHHIGVGQ